MDRVLACVALLKGSYYGLYQQIQVTGVLHVQVDVCVCIKSGSKQVGLSLSQTFMSLIVLK